MPYLWIDNEGRSLLLNDGLSSLVYSIFSAGHVQNDFQLVDHDVKQTVSHPIDSDIAFHDEVQSVGGGAVSGIVDGYSIAIDHWGRQDPVSSVVDIQNHYVFASQVLLNGCAIDKSSEFDAQRIDGRPHKQVAADVAAVAIEPGIEWGGVVVVS